MTVFAYRAKDKGGRNINGSIESDSAEAAIRQLRSRGLFVLDVQIERDLASQLQRLDPRQYMSVGLSARALSLRQLSVMLRSGLTLLSALKTISEQSTNRRLSQTWSDVRDQIESGRGFAETLFTSGVFSELTVQLARVGEQTGALDVVLERASEALDQRRELRRSIMQALLYPTIVIVMTIGVVAFMIFHLIPKLKVFLNALGRDLPPMTQFLLDFSDFSQAYLVQGLVLLGAFTVGMIAVYRWPPGRLVIDKWTLKIPIIGRILSLSGTVLFAKTLRLLLGSGVSLLDSLRTVEQLVANRHMTAAIQSARNEILRGSNLAGPLQRFHAFDPMLPKMIAVGEEAGTLEEVLLEASNYYELELGKLIKLLGTLIEPMIIGVVGGIVGFVYIAVFMALYSFA